MAAGNATAGRRCRAPWPQPRRLISNRENLALRERLLTALIAGEKPEMTASQWSPITVGRLAAAVNVAEAALDAAKEHAALQWSAALRSLILQLVRCWPRALVLAIRRA